MKKLFFTLVLCLFCSLQSMSQKKYEIYKVSGKVEFANPNKEKLQKGRVVFNSDIITINNEASISLIDIINNKLYEYSKAGTYKIEDIVNSCINESNNITRRIIRELKSNMSDRKVYLHSVSAVRRGDEEYLESVYSFIMKHLNDSTNVDSVSLECNKVDNGFVFFRLFNNTSTSLYANVLSITNGNNPYFCYEDEMTNLMLEPNSELNVDYVRFLDRGQTFFLICSEKPYDTNIIQEMIEDQYIPDILSSEVEPYYSFVLKTGLKK